MGGEAWRQAPALQLGGGAEAGREAWGGKARRGGERQPYNVGKEAKG